MNVQLRIAGENALMVYFSGETYPREATALAMQHQQQMTNGQAAWVGAVRQGTQIIERTLGDDLIDLIPSYASILVLFDAANLSHAKVMRALRAAFSHAQTNSVEAIAEQTSVGESMLGETNNTVVTLPVLYSQEVGADLADVANATGLSIADVIDRHSAPTYQVAAIGFAPGFAYLADLDERLALPRLATPRAQVARGSVAIAERQTAVYPAQSPGGWHVIGRCPTPLFVPCREPPMPVRVGDSVRFESIAREQFLALGGELD